MKITLAEIEVGLIIVIMDIAIRMPCIQNDKTLRYNEWIHLTNFYLRLLVVEHLLLIAQPYLLLLTVLVLKKSYN